MFMFPSTPLTARALPTTRLTPLTVHFETAVSVSAPSTTLTRTSSTEDVVIIDHAPGSPSASPAPALTSSPTSASFDTLLVTPASTSRLTHVAILSPFSDGDEWTNVPSSVDPWAKIPCSVDALSRAEKRCQTSAFAQGEYIHPTLPDHTSLQVYIDNGGCDDPYSESDWDTESDGSSESSSWSDIVPADDYHLKVWVGDYLLESEARDQRERENRMAQRKIGLRAPWEKWEGHGRTRDWVCGRSMLTDTTAKPSAKCTAPATRNELYTTLSPEPWLARPKVDRAAASAVRPRRRRSAAKLMMSLVVSGIEVKE